MHLCHSQLKGNRLFRPLFLLVFCFSAFVGNGLLYAEGSVRVVLDQFGGLSAQRSDVAPLPRLAAEFENPRVLLLSVSDWQPHHRHVLVEIAQKTAGHVNLLVLCNDTAQIKETTKWLLEKGSEFPHVYFCEIELNTVWLRDFGPIFAQTETGAMALDFYYEGTRPKDDALPEKWCDRSDCQHVKVPWTAHGGNLMSNGQGLALSTNRIFIDNYIKFPKTGRKINPEQERRVLVVKELMKFCNLSQLVVLEPLQEESTKHVDMFTSFISKNDLLVAQIDPRRDPVNAKIMERNIIRLKRIKVDGEPLRVHPVPIPVRDGKAWSAYTNSIVARNLVLLPVYDSDPPHITRAAAAAYRRLLPKHRIETIDMTSMKKLQGELHCLSLHVPAFVPLPDRIYSFDNSQKAYYPQGLKPQP